MIPARPTDEFGAIRRQRQYVREQIAIAAFCIALVLAGLVVGAILGWMLPIGGSGAS